MDRPKLNVFLTVDTEVWPRTPDWRSSGLEEELGYFIYGRTRDGDYGLSFQIDMLNAYGLKGVFLVETLFACIVGLEPLRRIVSLIQTGGHEVQLHLHTEWLTHMSDSVLPKKTGQNIKDFSEEEQTMLIARALDNLRAAGASSVCAFRAGNFGANFDTLRALARNGILFDTSHNTCYLDSDCGMRTPDPVLQPVLMHGVYEFPVSYFSDWPGHYRHAQLCACSWSELESALRDARRRSWYAFVVVLHSFELIRHGRSFAEPAGADSIVIRRYERLCRFLANNRDQFQTAVFSDIAPQGIPAANFTGPLRSKLSSTVWRFAEQMVRRIA